MSDYALIFDGHDIGAAYAVERHATRTMGSWEPTLVDVPGRAGSLFAATRRTPAVITFDVYAMDETREGRQASMRQLAAWLSVDSPRQLVLGDEGGLRRMAIPTGESVAEALLNADHAEVTFTCPDPRLWGEHGTATVSTTATVTVGGTAPTAPTIRATAAQAGDGGFWRLVDETGAGVYVELGSGTHAIDADCAARTLAVDGATVALPPAFDWPSWAAGEHTLTLTGTGAATVEWDERWW